MIPLISFLLPTRGRPELVKRFINSAKVLADCPESFEIILYVDEDDISPPIESNHKNLKIIYGPRTSMGTCNSRCLAEAIGEIIVLANDDVVLKTKGWDTEIRKIHEKYFDGIYLAYPNDLFKKKRGAAFPILSRKTCTLLAQPFPSIYKGSFIDTHILDIFIRLKFLGLNRIYYLEGVIFEHLHFLSHQVEKMASFASGVNAFLSSPLADKIVGPNPTTTRGCAIHINFHPTQPKIIYPSGKFIIIKTSPQESFANIWVHGLGTLTGLSQAQNDGTCANCASTILKGYRMRLLTMLL
jgi:hypothetical protein